MNSYGTDETVEIKVERSSLGRIEENIRKQANVAKK